MFMANEFNVYCIITYNKQLIDFKNYKVLFLLVDCLNNKKHIIK